MCSVRLRGGENDDAWGKQMIRLRFVLIAVICVSITSVGIIFAQDAPKSGGTVRGQITDTTAAENPIEDVAVKIVGRSGNREFTTKTDADGNYECSGIPTDRYLISTFKEGYQSPPRKPMTILNGGAYFVPLKLAEKGKGNVEPLVDVQPKGIDNNVRSRIMSLLQRVAESVGKRYDLDAAAVKALHQSILDSVKRTLGQAGGLSTFAEALEKGNTALLEMLLSHPVFQVAFTEHLSGTQFQDYLDFTVARRQRDRQAVARRMTVALDKELSLTTDQRDQVVQSLLDTAEIEAFPLSVDILGIGSQETIDLAHYELEISLNGILSGTQSKLLHGLVDRLDTNNGPVFNPKKPVGADWEDEKAVDVLNKSIQVKDNTAKSQERMKWINAAKLAAHTELLGPLDERAARRLALAAKGTVQQSFENQEGIREQVLRGFEGEFRKRIEAGEMTLEQAAVGLQVIRNDLWDVDRMNRQRGESSASGITKQRLYQQAIKDVLSEEAFARYNAHQAEREALRLQALRDIVVACMDAQLLLDDAQREWLETAASHLAPVPYAGSKPAEFMFFELFRRATNFEILTLWQQSEFERAFAPIMWEK